MTTAVNQVFMVQRRRRRRRNAATIGCFVVVGAIAYLVLLGQGPVQLAPRTVIDVLTGGGTPREIAVVWDLRLPVAIATLIIGAALGLAGAWTQTMGRNPLASPDILGVSAGAAAMVVAGTVLTRPGFAADLPTFWWRAGLSMIGALGVIVVLTLLGGIGSSDRIVLTGFGISVILQAITSYLMLKAELRRAAETQIWLAGSTGFIRMDALVPLVIGLIPFVLIGAWCARDLPLLAHDDDSASTLGVNVKRSRALLLFCATGVTAVVVSLAGPIGFIALIAPHIARFVAGAPIPPPLASAAAGAALLCICAVIAGQLSVNAPVGAVTSVIGGIALVIIVWKHSGEKR